MANTASWKKPRSTCTKERRSSSEANPKSNACINFSKRGRVRLAAPATSFANKTLYTPKLRRLTLSTFALAQPVASIFVAFNPSVKTRWPPLMRTLDEPMFDGVVMNVVGVRTELRFISQDMIPESTLPNTTFPSFLARLAASRFRPASRDISPGKSSLDCRPSHRKI